MISQGGLQSSDCANTGNPQQVPLLGLTGNVACRVQPAVNWGNGQVTELAAFCVAITALFVAIGLGFYRLSRRYGIQAS